MLCLVKLVGVPLIIMPFCMVHGSLLCIKFVVVGAGADIFLLAQHGSMPSVGKLPTWWWLQFKEPPLDTTLTSSISRYDT